MSTKNDQQKAPISVLGFVDWLYQDDSPSARLTEYCLKIMLVFDALLFIDVAPKEIFVGVLINLLANGFADIRTYLAGPKIKKMIASKLKEQR